MNIFFINFFFFSFSVQTRKEKIHDLNKLSNKNYQASRIHQHAVLRIILINPNKRYFVLKKFSIPRHHYYCNTASHPHYFLFEIFTTIEILNLKTQVYELLIAYQDV